MGRVVALTHWLASSLGFQESVKPYQCRPWVFCPYYVVLVLGGLGIGGHVVVGFLQLSTNIMTGLDNTLPPTPLSEKLLLVTHHHLLTRVPVKLDLDDWNYGQWDFFFVQLCESYNVDKYLCTPTTESSTSSSAPLTPKELKVDKIVLFWILFTLFDSLRARVVVARTKSAKEA
ncbi:hypothetical protein Tco_0902814 [Tanacetum coccineum]